MDTTDAPNPQEQEAAWMEAAEEIADFAERKVPEDPIRLRVLVDNLIHDFTDLKRQRIEREGLRPGATSRSCTDADLRKIEGDWLGRGFLRAANGIGYLIDLARIDNAIGSLGN